MFLSFYSGETNNDKWVINKIFKHKRDGYFIEAGAMAGVWGSNTYTLEKYLGWRGICVEPSDDMFKQLKKNRKCTCENLCLADRAQDVQYMEVTEEGYQGYGGIIENLSMSKKKYWKDGIPKVKKAITFCELLKKNNAPKTIDYLTLDLEGGEYNVLKNFPFNEYTFLAITIEGESCNDLLISKGYRLVRNILNIKAPWEQYFLHKSMVSGISNEEMYHAS